MNVPGQALGAMKCPICGADFTSPPPGPPLLPLGSASQPALAPIRSLLLALSASRITAIATSVIAVCLLVLVLRSFRPAESIEEKRIRYAKVCKEYDRVAELQRRVDMAIEARGAKTREAREAIRAELSGSWGIHSGELERIRAERDALADELGLK